jgi:hypothetical protein
MYSRQMVELSIELHIAPQQLFARMCEIANLETPRVERIWQEYSRNPKRLTRAVQLLRNMMGFNSSGGFYEGVEVEETFERDFRPVSEDTSITPMMLILVLDLYFRLTPITMVPETPEIQELGRLMKIPAREVADIMDIYQHCDPYLNRKEVVFSPLFPACQDIWQRYGNMDTEQLASYAQQLKAYFRS